MSLNDRQRQLQLQLHARDEDEQLLDVFGCVEELHAMDLHRMLSLERGEYRFSRVPRTGKSPCRVVVRQLALALPRHVLGCLLSGQPAVPADAATVELTTAKISSSSCFDHVTKALTLITSLCELSFHHKSLRQATLAQPAFELELIDAANMCLLAVAGPEADELLASAASQQSVQRALDRASMVPAALRTLAFAFTARSGNAAAGQAADGVLDWQAICEALLQHPRGAALLEAGFDAVRAVVLSVRAGLVGDTEGEAVYRLAYCAGAATELLSYMCVTPLFYQRLMLHDESGAAPLRLVLACLTLHDTPMAAPPFARSTDKATSAATSKLVAVQPPYCTEKGEGAAELLAARGFALLLMLSECEQPSFMDQVAQHTATRRLADHVNNRAAAYMGQVLLRPSTAHFASAPGESQMAINTLRAAELLSDDSNFRAGLIPLLAPTSAHLLALDAESFRSRWCAGPEAVAYHQADDILINSVSTASLEAVKSYERAAAAAFPQTRGKQARALRMGQHLALERAVLLAKLLVNLHVYVEGTCSPDLKEAFVRRMVQVLRSPPAAAVQRLQCALRNLHQLQRLLAPFGPPNAPPEQQLLSEIDAALLADLIYQVSLALAQSQQPPQQQQQQQQQEQTPTAPALLGSQPPPPQQTPAASAALPGNQQPQQQQQQAAQPLQPVPQQAALQQPVQQSVPPQQPQPQQQSQPQQQVGEQPQTQEEPRASPMLPQQQAPQGQEAEVPEQSAAGSLQSAEAAPDVKVAPSGKDHPAGNGAVDLPEPMAELKQEQEQEPGEGKAAAMEVDA